MLAEEHLEKIPEEQHDAVKAVYSLLSEVKRNNKMGLNITHIRQRTELSHTFTLKALSSLSALGFVTMEKQGSSKVYRLEGESR